MIFKAKKEVNNHDSINTFIMIKCDMGFLFCFSFSQKDLSISLEVVIRYKCLVFQIQSL